MRRPMNEQEKADAGALGTLILALRESTGLTQRTVARSAEVGERHLRRLEHGERRTWCTTLARIARALAGRESAAGDVQALVHLLITKAGSAIAPETKYPERVDARRMRRVQRARRRDHSIAVVQRLESSADTLERHVREFPDGGRRRRRHVHYTLTVDDQRRRLAANPELHGLFPPLPEVLAAS